MNKPVTRSDVRQVAVNLMVGCVLVGLAAVAIDQRPRGDQQDFGRLEFPITDADRAQAEAARAVRDAVDAALAAGMDPLLAAGPDVDALVDALIAQGFLDAEWHEQLEDVPLRARRCVDRIGVVVESAVKPEVADLEWWTSNDCDDDADLVRGAFVAVTSQQRDS